MMRYSDYLTLPGSASITVSASFLLRIKKVQLSAHANDEH
jgi:hypothetical protein